MINTKSTTRPATRGECGVIVCKNVADLEVTKKIGPGWSMSRYCFDCAPDEVLEAMHEESARA